MLDKLHNKSTGQLVLRLTVGILMLFHGIAKITNSGSVDFIASTLSSYGLPSFIAYGVYIGEILAPLLVIVGYYCREGALLMALNMIVAVLLVHTGDIFALGKHGGWAIELQAFYLFGSVAIVLLGTGKYAIKPE